jgi:hypothetical protein
MFQYATAFALARRTGSKLAIDTSWYAYTHEKHRRYSLHAFSLSAPVITRSAITMLVYKVASAQRRGASVCGKLVRKSLRLTDIREELPYKYVAIQPPPNAHAVRLIGYWQSPYYFAQAREDLLREFAFAVEPNARTSKLLSRIAGANVAVAVHVRRGDYVRMRPEALLPVSYYSQAADIIRGTCRACQFFVFCDEPAWAQQHLSFLEDAHFVDADDKSHGADDLRAMMTCKHFIIANSSFSWWAAYLGAAASSKVIVPRMWLGSPQDDDMDNVPADWIRL